MHYSNLYIYLYIYHGKHYLCDITHILINRIFPHPYSIYDYKSDDTLWLIWIFCLDVLKH